MHILNPDKEPLPWRYYCSVPSTSTAPPSLYPSTSYLSHIKTLRNTATNPPPEFPPPDLDTIPPVGVFVGVFSLDSSFERRQLIRSTWAGHKRSRYGAGEGDGGLCTSRTIVRFILGQPSKDWERRIMLEMESESCSLDPWFVDYWLTISAFVSPPQPIMTLWSCLCTKT